MDRDYLRRLLKRLKPKQEKFAFEFNGFTFIKIQGGAGFPADCERIIYKVQGRLREVWMYVVLEYFIGQIRVNFYSEFELSTELFDVGAAFEKFYINLLLG